MLSGTTKSLSLLGSEIKIYFVFASPARARSGFIVSNYRISIFTMQFFYKRRLHS